MTVIQRLLLLIILIAFILTSFIFALFSWKLFPQAHLLQLIAMAYGRWYVGFVSGILFLLGIWVLVPMVYRGKAKSTIIHENPLGQVKISLAAIDGMIHRLLEQKEGISRINTSLWAEEAGLSIRVKADVSPDLKLPGETRSLQEEIKEYIQETAGVNVEKVEILVNAVESKPQLRVE